MTLRSRVLSACSAAFAWLLLLSPVQAQSSAMAPDTSSLRPSIHASALSPEIQGDLLAARRRYVEAIAVYQKAPQDSAVVVNKLGVAYHHMFDTTDAKKCYQRAIHLDKSYAEAYNNLGAIFHSEKNYKQAQHYYRKAIKLNPSAPLFYSNLGTAYFFQGNAKKGADAYQRAFTLDPSVFEQNNSAHIEESSSTKDLAAVNYVLAKTYAQAGRNDRALAYLRKALGEGFSDRKKLMTDREFATLRETPEFLQLVDRQTARQ